MDAKDHVLWHLDRDFTNPIRDPLWGHIYLTDGLYRIVDTLESQQLAKIKQLGPSYLVYPGATHTRLAHSLGVYHIAYRMIRSLLGWEATPALTRELVDAYLCAALLHDLGHFPFTHSLKELPLREHEALAAEMIQSGDLATTIREELGVDPGIVARIIDEELDDLGEPAIPFFRSLLSGTLDPDKLDYLNRDAYFCGVPYGTQDIDFALSRLRPVATGVGLDITGISAVENILFSKYLMYRAVYWHRNVRVATAMIKRGLYDGLRTGLITEQDLYGHTDESFYSGFSARSEPPFELIRNVYDRRLFQPVIDIAFRDDDPAHLALESLDHRAVVETRIREEIGPAAGTGEHAAVLIDIPEGISFEVSFPVVDGKQIVDYPSSGSVFTPAVIADFTRTLRRIRLILRPDLADRVPEPAALLERAIGES
jgi:HD superfamily phosphohydrolase